MRFSKIAWIGLAIGLFINALPSKAQVYTGGNFGINFGTVTIIDVSPLIGYQYKKARWAFSPFFSYYKASGFEGNYFYGGRTFMQFDIISEFFLHAEVDFLNVEDRVNNLDPVTLQPQGRTWIWAVPLGGGVNLPISERSQLQLILLYNILDTDRNSPFANPIVRGGINIRL